MDEDPLAFMAKAQQEKKQAAEKKAKLEAQAEAAWKKTEDLEHNLFSKYMD